MKQALQSIVTSVPPLVLFLFGVIAAISVGLVQLQGMLEAASDNLAR